MEAVLDPGVRRPPLVRPVFELRCMGRTWLVVAAVVASGDAASGAIGRLSTAALEGAVGLLALSVAASVARVLLGRRTPPEYEYGQIFDRSFEPTPDRDLDPDRRTAARAGWAALGVAFGLCACAPAAMAVVLVMTGTPTGDLGAELPAASALVAAGWILACAAAGRVIATWLHEWEGRRGRVLLCPPLMAGRMSPIYFSVPARS